MAVQKIVLKYLDHQALIEARRMQICRLLGLQQLGVQQRRGNQVAQA